MNGDAFGSAVVVLGTSLVILTAIYMRREHFCDDYIVVRFLPPIRSPENYVLELMTDRNFAQCKLGPRQTEEGSFQLAGLNCGALEVVLNGVGSVRSARLSGKVKSLQVSVRKPEGETVSSFYEFSPGEYVCQHGFVEFYATNTGEGL